jgi:hypothetical protein
VFALSEGGLLYVRVARGAGMVTLEQIEGAALPAATFAEGPLGGPLRAGAAFAESLGQLLERVTERPEDASLVLPDRWLRAVLADGSDLPRSQAARHEAILWKLRRLVPFRVDELRVRECEIAPVSPEGPRRVLLGFAIELLLNQIEDAFLERGVRLGRITSTSLALASGLFRESQDEPSTSQAATLLSVIGETGYSLLVVVKGRPQLYRYKALEPTLDRAVLGPLVRRELALTLSFLSETLPGLEVERALLLSSESVAPDWLLWLQEALEANSETVGPPQLGLEAGAVPMSQPWHLVAPMVAATLEEVA